MSSYEKATGLSDLINLKFVMADASFGDTPRVAPPSFTDLLAFYSKAGVAQRRDEARRKGADNRKELIKREYQELKE